MKIKLKKMHEFIRDDNGWNKGCAIPTPPLFMVRKTYTRWENDKLGAG